MNGILQKPNKGRLADAIYAEAELARKDPEGAFGFLFDGLPMRHRIRLVEEDGMCWIKVSFVDSRRKAWCAGKYFMPDILLHPDDYVKDVENLCYHAMARMKEGR